MALSDPVHFDAVPDGLFAFDPETGDVLSANDAFVELVGQAGVRGTDVSALAAGGSPADRDRIRRAREDGSVRFTWRVRTADRGSVPVESTLGIEAHAKAEVAVVSVREATERRERDPYETLFERCPVILWEFDLSAAKEYADRLATGTDDLTAYLEAYPEEYWRLMSRVEVLDVNERAVEFYDASSKAELRTNLDALLTEKAHRMWRRLWRDLTDGKRSLRTECVARTLAGDRRVVLTELLVPEAHAEECDRVLMTCLDITERERRKRELAAEHSARQELQKALSETATAGAFIDAVRQALTAIGDVSAASVGTVTPTGAIEPLGERREVTGSKDAMLPNEDGDHPAAVATREGEVRIGTPTDGDRRGPSRPGATDPGGADVMAVPIRFEDVTRGVLTVRLARQRVLGEERLLELIEETADVLGYAIGNARCQRTLSADDRVEMVVDLETGTTPLSRVTTETGVTATVAAAIPRDGDTALCHVSVADDERAAFVAAAGDVDGVEPVGSGTGRGPEPVQAVVRRPLPTTVVAEQGGLVVDATLRDTMTTLTVRLPRGEAFDPMLDALRARFDEVRIGKYTTEPTAPRHGDPMSRLTDRQRDVLEVAFRSGYFEQPRTQNAGDVADRLGISRQAYSQILRTAQRNLLTELL